MRAGEVLSVLDALQAKGLRVWLDGGWGVDALLEEETRTHQDVDLVVELEALSDVMDTLGGLGFDLVEDDVPTRAVMRATDGRQVDLHPVSFATDGTGWQRGASPDGSDCAYPPSGFGQGRILDRVVPCLAPGLQLEHHRGYDPRVETALTWRTWRTGSASRGRIPTDAWNRRWGRTSSGLLATTQHLADSYFEVGPVGIERTTEGL